MALGNYAILILETEVGQFATDLQDALDRLGAESLIARDAGVALQRCDQFDFSAALVNANHSHVLEELTARGIPALSYNRSEEPGAIVGSLVRLLDGL